MTIEIVAALAVFAFAGSITPGPNNLMLLTSGATFGFRRSVPHIAGVIIGFLLLVVLVGLGLMQVFTVFPKSYTALKIAAVAYLLFLAWKIATAARPDVGDGDGDGVDGNSTGARKSRPLNFWQAALFQYVNPKGLAFSLAAVSAYTPPSRPLSSVFIVAAVFTVANLVSTCTWTAAGVQARRLLSNPVKLRAFNIIVAVLLAGSLYPIVFD